APRGGIDARRGREARRPPRLERDHAHVGGLERTAELPDGLLEPGAVCKLDDDVRADLGEELLTGCSGPLQDAVALAPGNDVELAALGQVRQRRAVEEDGVPGEVE